jgi:hypothetical protein
MRHLLLAAVGALALVGPHGAAPLQAAPPGLAPAGLTLYAVDNPAQPGDAFPNSPYSGGTD